jgi:hypothetical protein
LEGAEGRRRCDHIGNCRRRRGEREMGAIQNIFRKKSPCCRALESLRQHQPVAELLLRVSDKNGAQGIRISDPVVRGLPDPHARPPRCRRASTMRGEIAPHPNAKCQRDWMRPRMCAARLLRISAANIGPNRFHQNRTVSWLMSILRSAREIFDVAQGQWISHVHHHHQTDDLRRAVEISERVVHSSSLARQRDHEHLV